MRAWTAALGGDGHTHHLARVGRVAGRDATFEQANQANRYEIAWVNWGAPPSDWNREPWGERIDIAPD